MIPWKALAVIMLIVAFTYCYAECSYAERHYAEKHTSLSTSTRPSQKCLGVTYALAYCSKSNDL
jgi:hypothetical protein